MAVFAHYSGGKRYTSIGLESAPATMADYRARVREVYGTLHGVRFETLAPGKGGEYGREWRPDLRRIGLAVAIARFGNDWHGGGASRGYRLMCVAMRFLRRRGIDNPLDRQSGTVESIARPLYLTLENDYAGRV